MHKAKTFFYVCAGLFLLALSYHLGARNAGAQQGSMVSGFDATQLGIQPNEAVGTVSVMTPNGDIFTRYMNSNVPGISPVLYVGNLWSGSGPVPAQRSTFGALKSRYRAAPGAALPTTQDR